MSFATNLAAAQKSPLWMAEWDGDTVLTLDALAGIGEGTWVAGTADVTGLAATTTCKQGAGGITWNKTGTAGAGGYIVNSTIPAFDFTTGAYHGLAVYLPTVATFANWLMRVGSSGANYVDFRWSRPSGYQFVAGWNYLRFANDATIFDGSRRTRTVGGSPAMTAVTYMLIGFEFSLAADTYSGVIIDWLRRHPYRHSTGDIDYPEAPTKKGWLQVPYIGPNSEYIQEGSINVSSASASIVDDGAATVIADLDRFAFAGRVATFSQGFRGEVEDPNTATNWKPVYRGVTFAPRHLGKAWQFQFNSLLEKMRRPFVQAATDAAHVTVSGITIVAAWLRFALSTGNGTNNPTYDVLSAANGAGIPADSFDIAEIEEQATDWLPLDMASFELKAPEQDFLAWSFREFFLAYGIVPVVKADGRISIQVVRPPFGDDSTREFGESNVVTLMPDYSEGLESLYNQVTIHYNYALSTDSWPDYVRVGDSTSQARYGVRDLAIKSKGITDSDTATRVSKRILARLGNGAPPIRLEAFMSEQETELGELVQVSHAAVPDTVAGTYGISGKLAEVISRGFNPQTCRTSLTLALTSYQLGNYRRIGPASLTTNYDASTAAERARYCFIADTSNTLGAANDPAHVIGPL